MSARRASFQLLAAVVFTGGAGSDDFFSATVGAGTGVAFGAGVIAGADEPGLAPVFSFAVGLGGEVGRRR